MFSKICFVPLCVFAVQLHGAEEQVSRGSLSEFIIHRNSYEKRTSYYEWNTKNSPSFIRTCVFTKTTDNNDIIPDQYEAWHGDEECDVEPKWLTPDQAKAEFFRLEKEYEEQEVKKRAEKHEVGEAERKIVEERTVQTREKSVIKPTLAVIAGATLLYVSTPDCVKEFVSDVLKLVTQTFF